jgi:hypothetical protein
LVFKLSVAFYGLIGLLSSPAFAQQIPGRNESGGTVTTPIMIPANPELSKRISRTISKTPRNVLMALSFFVERVVAHTKIYQLSSVTVGQIIAEVSDELALFQIKSRQCYFSDYIHVFIGSGKRM